MRTLTKQTTLITLIITLLASLMLMATPAAAFTDMNGKPATIDSLVGKGKWSVFKIWSADCHVCRQTIHYLSDFEASYPAADVFGISIDGAQEKQKAQAFIDDYNLSFPNLLGDSQEMSDFLYAKAKETLMGTPTTLVFNPKGKLVAVQPGAVTAKELVSFIQREEAAGQAE